MWRERFCFIMVIALLVVGFGHDHRLDKLEKAQKDTVMVCHPIKGEDPATGNRVCVMGKK